MPAEAKTPNGDEPCVCGHTVEEHRNGFLRSCEECGCCDYEPDMEAHGGK